MNTCEPDSPTAKLVKDSGRAVHLLFMFYMKRLRSFEPDETLLMCAIRDHLASDWAIDVPEARVAPSQAQSRKGDAP